MYFYFLLKYALNTNKETLGPKLCSTAHEDHVNMDAYIPSLDTVIIMICNLDIGFL